jgi:uncharacterized protein with PIN domain
MKFWDASAVIALLIDEPAHPTARALLEADPVMLTWWATAAECVAAIARRERDQSMTAAHASAAVARLQALSSEWHEVLASDVVRSIAQRMLRVHALGAGDCLQLAAAMIAAEHDPTTLAFVSLDSPLSEAASREGFRVIVPEKQRVRV